MHRRPGRPENRSRRISMSLGAKPFGEKKFIEIKGRRMAYIDEGRSEEHTSELQSLMRISYAVFCLKKKKIQRLVLNSHSSITKRTKGIAKLRNRITQTTTISTVLRINTNK